MALMTKVSVDGEDVEIREMSDVVLTNAIRGAQADWVACALIDIVRASDLARSKAVQAKYKALMNEARRRKLDV
jgi:hypothetical protein